MKLKLALPAAIGLAASSAPAAELPAAGACSREAVAAAGKAVRSARAELMAVPLEADGTLVPPATSRLIEGTKDRLRVFVRAEMACAPASADPEALAAAMAAQGDAFVDAAPDDRGPSRAVPSRQFPGLPRSRESTPSRTCWPWWRRSGSFAAPIRS